MRWSEVDSQGNLILETDRRGTFRVVWLGTVIAKRVVFTGTNVAARSYFAGMIEAFRIVKA